METNGRLLTFRNVKIGKAEFASATYDADADAVVGYAFIRDVSGLDALVGQLRAAIRPNAFVDELRVVSDDGRLARVAREQLARMALDDLGLANVGLYLLNPETGDFDELISPAANADFWYKTYVKPTEVRRLLAAAGGADAMTLPVSEQGARPVPAPAQKTASVPGDGPVAAAAAKPQESLISILEDYDRHLIDTTEIFRKFVSESAQSLERETRELEQALAGIRGDAAPSAAAAAGAGAQAPADELAKQAARLDELLREFGEADEKQKPSGQGGGR